MSETSKQADPQTKQPTANQKSGKKKVERKPNNPMGIYAGIGATILISAIWMVVSFKFRISGMALLAGFGISYSILYAGNTNKPWYGYLGAALTIVAILCGHYTTAIMLISKHDAIPVTQVISEITFSKAFAYFYALMKPFDYLVYLAGIIAGYYFSFKHPPKNPMP